MTRRLAAVAIGAAALVLAVLYVQAGRIAPSPTPGDSASAVAPPPPTTDDFVLGAVRRPRFGDFDSMLARRIIRVLVAPSLTQYFLDQGTPRGLTVDIATLLETELNRKYRTGARPIRVVIVPVEHDEILPALLAGEGDLVISGVTITPERQAKVDFSAPTLTNVSEVVVTGPASPALASLNDLAGHEVFVRRSSAYYDHLQALNADFGRRGLAPVRLRLAPEELQDEDLLEMLNAGLVQVVVLNDILAGFWAQVLPNIRPQLGLAISTGDDLGWVFRKDSPRLREEVNAFLALYPAGSATRNTLLHRYLRSTKYVSEATSQGELDKFYRMVGLFRKYGNQYDLDHLLLMAQGYQESRLDQGARSAVGAVGVMQVMPATGQSLGVGDIHQLEPNIHAGVKYIRWLVDQYFSSDSIDALNRTLLAFAAYNAGPARVAGLRKKAAARGLDPNRWNRNVELVAAEEVGRETVNYVGNIYKYYVAYSLLQEQAAEREAARRQHGAAPTP